MKEHVKLFPTIASADGHVIDVPFIASVTPTTEDADPLNIQCAEPYKKLKVVGDVIKPVYDCSDSSVWTLADEASGIIYNIVSPIVQYDVLLASGDEVNETSSNISKSITYNLFSGAACECVKHGSDPSVELLLEAFIRRTFGTIYTDLPPSTSRSQSFVIKPMERVDYEIYQASRKYLFAVEGSDVSIEFKKYGSKNVRIVHTPISGDD